MKRYVIIFTSILSIYSNVNAGSAEYCWVDQLSVRKEPSASSEIITFLKEGDEVEILERDLGNYHPVILRGMKFYTKWSKIIIKGIEGYVYSGGIESHKGKMSEIAADYKSLYDKYCKELDVRNYSDAGELIRAYYGFPKKAMKLLMDNRNESSHRNYDSYAKAVLDAIDEKYKKMLSDEFYLRYSLSLLNGGGIRSGYFGFLYDRYLDDVIVKINGVSDGNSQILIKRKYIYFENDSEGVGIGADELPYIIEKYKITNITQKQFNEIQPDSFEMIAEINIDIPLNKKGNYYCIENVEEKIIRSKIVFIKNN
ncbi:MAG TPA: SH3 domain-containing protein [Spirochaetota bacterium]|nr:SH3 domain-containing protein [Spirochaetota bacterium]HOH36631.1 SH3 domain-containing protein [Spirochaetota bacterium]HPJ16467.1 SH3 domain-containing protein [Spirochaetota bacterium]HPY02293.1 SH3 domain-containing protein [Spirochaetota bacterium]HQA51826.1 SH3 domain-containing protein [Spirochaetota bacterium]